MNRVPAVDYSFYRVTGTVLFRAINILQKDYTFVVHSRNSRTQMHFHTSACL